MPEEFYEWLDQCPVEWFYHADHHPDYATYAFVKTNKEENSKDE